MSKDEDFKQPVERNGPSPQVIWITCGNMSNDRMKALLSATFPDATMLLERGESVVEIRRQEK